MNALINQISQEFRIPAQNIDTLTERLEKLNRRAKRLHTAPITLEQLGTDSEKDQYGMVSLFYRVRVSGETPIVNGWIFVATLEHTYDDQGAMQNIIHAVPGLISDGELSGYYNSDPQCDHCHQNRLRNDTYLLKSSSGEIKQVGRTCLKDFTGHADPMSVAASAEILSQAMEEASSCTDDDLLGGGYGGKVSAFDLECYLAWVHACMRKYGWVSRGDARDSFGDKAATADVAIQAMDYYKKNPYSAFKPSDADQETSKLALEWVRELQVLPDDYMHNLYTICKLSYVNSRNVGTAASLFSAYNRAMKEKQVAVTSEWQGEVGQRTIFTLTCDSVKYIESPVYGRRGFTTTSIYNLSDEKGNQFVWFSSRDVLNVKETYTLKATVKDQGLYREVKQTVLTRCTIQ